MRGLADATGNGVDTPGIAQPGERDGNDAVAGGGGRGPDLGNKEGTIMTWQHGMRMTVVAATAFGMVVFGAAGAFAQEAPATLEIHKAECETGVGAAIFEECHDNRVEDVRFNVDLPTESTIDINTDENGEIAVGLPEVGAIVIYEDGADAADYIGVYVYCRDLTEDEVLFDGALTADTVEGFYMLPITVTEGMEVVCDWYNITPAGDHVPTHPAMPNTGAGVMAGGTAPFAAMVATGLLALAGAAALRRRAA